MGKVRVRNTHRPSLDFEPYVIRLCSAANQRNLGLAAAPPENRMPPSARWFPAQSGRWTVPTSTERTTHDD